MAIRGVCCLLLILYFVVLHYFLNQSFFPIWPYEKGDWSTGVVGTKVGSMLTRQNATCTSNDMKSFGLLWKKLCSTSFLRVSDTILATGDVVHMVQIGAHTGFERNDPFAKGITYYLNLLSSEERRRFHWTFVEPAPPNFKRLQENIVQNSHLCNMSAVNAGVVPDSLSESNDSAMMFFSILDTIDPETGFDSISGKRLPNYVTQLSSFSMAPIEFNRHVWTRRGLKMEDYVVKTNVTNKRYSDLMRDIVMTDNHGRMYAPKCYDPFFVLIDTEGFDCKIISGISKSSLFWPRYLLFEHKQCGKDLGPTYAHLEYMNYTIKRIDGENTFAYNKEECQGPESSLLQS